MCKAAASSSQKQQQLLYRLWQYSNTCSILCRSSSLSGNMATRVQFRAANQRLLCHESTDPNLGKRGSGSIRIVHIPPPGKNMCCVYRAGHKRSGMDVSALKHLHGSVELGSDISDTMI